MTCMNYSQRTCKLQMTLAVTRTMFEPRQMRSLFELANSEFLSDRFLRRKKRIILRRILQSQGNYRQLRTDKLEIIKATFSNDGIIDGKRIAYASQKVHFLREFRIGNLFRGCSTCTPSIREIFKIQKPILLRNGTAKAAPITTTMSLCACAVICVINRLRNL